MYRVGFGDCFLLSLPVNGGHRHVLMDCGAHPSGDIRTLQRIVEDVAAVTQGELALVVATHEHADHISGFGAHADAFAKLRLGEVWMPWAMNLDDPKAAELRKTRLAVAAALAAHFAATGGSAAAAQALLNLQSNEPAVAALRSGFKGAAATVRYFSGGDAPPALAALPGLEVKVLGPPRDDDFLKRMEPPQSQRYLRLARGLAQTVNEVSPFAARWRFRDKAEGRRAYEFRQRTKRDLSEKEVAKGLSGALDQLAFKLDSIVNNTSLVLLLRYRGQSLLFPGDAQWGNWQSWLTSSGAAALLEEISFLKVAHHGSHNATPRSALEGLKTGAFAAMVSTQSIPFPTIPQPALMTRLLAQARKRVVRSDSLAVAEAPDAPKGPPMKTVPKGFKRGPFWADYVLGA
jgi:metallo-beta-lactamase superfamily protein